MLKDFSAEQRSLYSSLKNFGLLINIVLGASVCHSTVKSTKTLLTQVRSIVLPRTTGAGWCLCLMGRVWIYVFSMAGTLTYYMLLSFLCQIDPPRPYLPENRGQGGHIL